MTLAQQILTSQSKDVYAWVLLGRAQAALNQPQAAERSYRTALQSSRNAPEVVIQYARFLLDQTRDSMALRLLATAEQKQATLPLRERLPALHNLLGAVYARRSQMSQAEQQLLLSLEVAPDQPGTRRLLDAIRALQKTRLMTDGFADGEPVTENSSAP